MMNTDILLPSQWQHLLQQSIQHVYQITRQTWLWICRGKAPWMLILHFQNEKPQYAIESLKEKPNLEAWQPHALSVFLKDSQIVSISLDDQQHIVCELKQQEKNFQLVIQFTPYNPRFMLKHDQTIVFDSVHGWNPKVTITSKISPINPPSSMELQDLLLQATSDIYRPLLKQVLNKKLRRQKALDEDAIHHQASLSYQAIADAMQIEPNLPWQRYPNPQSLPMPFAQFKTNFDGVNQLYALYKKAKQGLIEVNAQQQDNQKAIAIVSELLASPLPDNALTLATMKDYLISNHLLSGMKTKPTLVDQKSPYYVEDHGMRFSFGKNAKQNDYLTFSIAKKSDIFMHIEGKPGSHLILHHSQFDHDWLVKGAQLVLALAKQTSGLVTYAKVGSLKRTTNLGQVLVKDAKHIKVNADPKWAEPLLKGIKRY
ncbi:MAG: hypothetical protein ACO3QN_02225 [Bacilli bacterium]